MKINNRQLLSPIGSKLVLQPQLSAGSSGALPRPQRDLVRTINDFQLIDKLGQGSFGVAYKAREIMSGEILVLKQL